MEPRISYVIDSLQSIPSGTGYLHNNGSGSFLWSANYGSMYADDASIAVTIGASGAYNEVPSGLSNGGSSSDFTFQSAKQLLCNTAGKYIVTWSMSITSSNNNEVISGTVMINSTHVSTIEGSAENINGGKPVCVSGSGIITLAINDVVKLCVENETAAHDITVTHATLSLFRVE